MAQAPPDNPDVAGTLRNHVSSAGTHNRGGMNTRGNGGVRTVGILLIILGAIALIWGGITYTKREEVVDIGPIEIEAEEKERIPLPPILGAIALVGGIVLLASGGRRAA